MKLTIFLLIPLFLIVFTPLQSLLAAPQPQAVFRTLGPNKQWTKTDWKYSISPLWEANPEGIQEFFYSVTVTMPVKSQLDSVVGQYSSSVSFTPNTDSKTESIELQLKLKASKEDFVATFADKSTQKFNVSLALPKSLTLVEGCEPFGITLPFKSTENSKAKMSQYMAFRCQMNPTGLALTIVVPEEVTWMSTTILESKGKGKRYKLFDINAIAPTAGNNQVGEFTLKAGDKSYTYAIQVPEAEAKREIAKFLFGLGAINLNLQTDVGTSSLSKMSALISLQVRPWSQNFSIGAQGLTSLPTFSVTEFYTHTESIGYCGYTFGKADGYSFEPRLYGYLADGISKKLTKFYTIMTLAVGFDNHIQMGKSSYLDVEFFGFSDAKYNVASARALLGFKNKTTAGGWGFYFIYHQMGIDLLETSKGKANNYAFGPFVNF